MNKTELAIELFIEKREVEKSRVVGENLIDEALILQKIGNTMDVFKDSEQSNLLVTRLLEIKKELEQVRIEMKLHNKNINLIPKAGELKDLN